MRTLAAALAGLALSILAAAQSVPEPVHGLPGKAAGTERWLVTFKERSFDLEAFRRASLSRAPAAAVAPIVARLEEQMRADQAPFVAFVKGLGGTVVAQWWIVNGCAIEVPAAQLARVRAHANVFRLDPDEVVEPTSIMLRPILTATNASNHNADAVQAQGIRGAGAVCAIMDTGQDSASGTAGRPHRTYFSDGNLSVNSGGIGNSRLIANVQVGAMNADDTNGHGTGVAGIAAGGKWNNNANSDHGHAPQANIVGYAIADNTSGGASYTTVTSAWNRIASEKATFGTLTANNSYSGSPDPLHVSQQASDSLAYNADVLVVIAAGNSGNSTTSSQSCANGLSVAACIPTSKVIASFSSKGPLSGDSLRTYPDITGCGVGTVMPLLDDENNSTGYVADGTSMASPQVCGAGTLYRGKKTAASALETKAALIATAENIAPQNPALTVNAYGSGFARDDKLIDVAKGTGMVFNDALTTGATTRTFYIKVQGGIPQTVALAWNRQNMLTTSWTNMDLQVALGASSWSSTSPRNTYEYVRFTPATTGCATITVSAVTLEASQTSVPFCVVAPLATTCEIPQYSPIGNATVEGNASEYVPFGGQTSCSYQQLNADLAGRTGTFTRISFRRDGPTASGTFSAKSVNAALFFGGGATLGCTSNYASNYTGPRTNVVTTRDISMPNWSAPGGTPAPFNFSIPLDAPYVWTGASDFVFEFRVYNMTSTTTNPLDAVSTSDVGTNNGTGYGTACVAGGKTGPHLGGSTFTTELFGSRHTFAWTSSNGPNGVPGAWYIGVAATNLPLPDLCSNVYTLPVISIGGFTDAVGTMNVAPIPVAYSPAFVGAHLFAQANVLDPLRPNYLKFSVTNGVDGIVPASPSLVVARIVTPNDPNATAGTVKTGAGLVFCLD